MQNDQERSKPTGSEDLTPRLDLPGAPELAGAPELMRPPASTRGSSDLPPITSPPKATGGMHVLYVVYDCALGLIWALLLPVFLLLGLAKPRLARKALSLSTVGLPRLPSPAKPRVLVHGVSVGEVKASQSLVRALRERYDVVISAFSDTGLEVARQLYPDLIVVRFPIDFVPLVRRFWRRIRPHHVLLMELEAWPCFLREANRRGAPVSIVSGRITEHSFARYRLFGALPQFDRISLFAVQDETYAERFASLVGTRARIVVTGNVKVDGLRLGPAPRDERFDALARLAGGAPGQRVLVAGSTHEPEERLVLDAFRAADPSARIVLVPRHPDRADELEASLADARPQRLSRLRAGEAPDAARPLMVDTIGELERVYALADIVFVGGSLIRHGGQNMLEPAAQGKCVLYGPHTDNFVQETTLLERAGGARRVADAAALAVAVRELVADPAEARAMGERAVLAVERQRGATEATLHALAERAGLVTGAHAGRAAL
ncbi:MAG: glycosyltransferase N-terminal domain-containing protein [Planctomycetota bacterium]